MSVSLNKLPQIEGFQPIPNAVMIPFMETQSAALAYGFGLNYEYGKRKIRSMSNEQYNSLTSEQIAEMSAEHSEILLSRFITAVPKVMPAQTEIFKQYVEIEKLKVLQNVALAKWIAQNAITIATTGTSADAGSTIRETIPGGPAIPSSGGTSIVQDKSGNVTTTIGKNVINRVKFRYTTYKFGKNHTLLPVINNGLFDESNNFHFFHRIAEALRKEMNFLKSSSSPINKMKIQVDHNILVGLQNIVNPLWQAFV